MSEPVECQLIGRWRIVEADLWDRAYLDLGGPAYLEIADKGWAEFAFGAIEATAELEYGRTIVFFRWIGFDEGDEISGDGSAGLQDDGTTRLSCPSTTAMTPSLPAAANDFFNNLLVRSSKRTATNHNDALNSRATWITAAGICFWRHSGKLLMWVLLGRQSERRRPS